MTSDTHLDISNTRWAAVSCSWNNFAVRKHDASAPSPAFEVDSTPPHQNWRWSWNLPGTYRPFSRQALSSQWQTPTAEHKASWKTIAIQILKIGHKKRDTNLSWRSLTNENNYFCWSQKRFWFWKYFFMMMQSRREMKQESKNKYRKKNLISNRVGQKVNWLVGLAKHFVLTKHNFFIKCINFELKILKNMKIYIGAFRTNKQQGSWEMQKHLYKRESSETKLCILLAEPIVLCQKITLSDNQPSFSRNNYKKIL